MTRASRGAAMPARLRSGPARAAALPLSTLLLVLGCATTAPDTAAPDAARTGVTLSVIGTNDLHGGIIEQEGAGGLALFGGYLANLRKARRQDGGAVLLIDAGDMWQGTLESNLAEGAAVVAAYNALDYDAAAIGNHEFDFGPEGPAATARSPAEDARGALRLRAAEAAFPLLAANLIDRSTGRPVAWRNVSPSALIDAAGVTVGVVGVMTRHALASTLAANTRGLAVAPLAATIELEAGRLRELGAAVIVVSAHAGGECTSFDDPADLTSCDREAEIFEVARALPAGLVDLIIGGHVHKGIAHEVNGIPIISSWSGGRFFGRVDLYIDATAGRIRGHRIHPPQRVCRRTDPASGSCLRAGEVPRAGAARYEGLPVAPDRLIARLVAPAVEAAARIKGEKLGPYVETPIRHGPDPESPLGNLLTDILLESAPGADVAIHNTVGGIRAHLPAGELTYGSVYEVFPFDNRRVLLTLTGAELKSILANQLEGPYRRGHVSGIRVEARCVAGALDLRVIGEGGREVADDDRLFVVSNDFLATGGDGILTPATPPGGFLFDEDGPLVRDLVADWMRRHGGTLNEEQLRDEQNPRWRFPGKAPVDCGTSDAVPAAP